MLHIISQLIWSVIAATSVMNVCFGATAACYRSTSSPTTQFTNTLHRYTNDATNIRNTSCGGILVFMEIISIIQRIADTNVCCQRGCV